MALTDSEVHTAWRDRSRAPADERREMNAGLAGTFFDPSLARQYAQNLPQGVNEASTTLISIEKAIRAANRDGRVKERGRKSLTEDPLTPYVTTPGVRPKRGTIHPTVLRQMRREDPILVAIFQNLKNRAQAYAKPVESGVATMLRGVEGFNFRPVGKKDHEPLSEHQERLRRRFVNFLRNGGDTPRFTASGPNREDLRRKTFSQFLNLVIEQRYIFDAVSIELEYTRDGRSLSGLYTLPGDTIHRIDERQWEEMAKLDIVRDNPDARFAQVLRDQIVTTYGSNDLYYDFVNAQDSLDMDGYGMSEVEMCARLTVGVVNVLKHTSGMFDRNAIPNSILLLRGTVSKEAIIELQESWNANRLGAGGEHTWPVITLPDERGSVEVIPVQKPPQDMAFTQYLSFLGAVDCSVFGIDASEINLSAFGGNNSNLSSGKDTDTKLTDSRNRAFMPMMMRLEELVNTVLYPMIGDEWEFRFEGLSKLPVDALQTLTLSSATVGEVREGVLAMPALEDATVNNSLVQNPALSQMILATRQRAEEAAAKGAGKGTGEPPKEPATPKKSAPAGRKGVPADD